MRQNVLSIIGKCWLHFIVVLFVCFLNHWAKYLTGSNLKKEGCDCGVQSKGMRPPAQVMNPPVQGGGGSVRLLVILHQQSWKREQTGSGVMLQHQALCPVTYFLLQVSTSWKPHLSDMVSPSVSEVLKHKHLWGRVTVSKNASWEDKLFLENTECHMTKWWWEIEAPLQKLRSGCSSMNTDSSRN